MDIFVVSCNNRRRTHDAQRVAISLRVSRPCRPVFPATHAGGGGSEEEGESDDVSDDEGDDAEGGMSVMDMLAANEVAEAAAAAAQSNPAAGKVIGIGKGKGKGRAGGSGAGAGMDESGSRTAPASDAGSTDDASGHELGSGGDDAMDEDDSDDDDDEGDEEERHARLMGFVGTLGEQAAAAQRAAEDRRSSQLLKEGEFNSTAVAAAGGVGGAKRGAVTMEVGKRAASGSAGALEVLRVAPACRMFLARNGKRKVTPPFVLPWFAEPSHCMSKSEQWYG